MEFEEPRPAWLRENSSCARAGHCAGHAVDAFEVQAADVCIVDAAEVRQTWSL
jgi:hypothetical protein